MHGAAWRGWDLNDWKGIGLGLSCVTKPEVMPDGFESWIITPALN